MGRKSIPRASNMPSKRMIAYSGIGIGLRLVACIGYRYKVDCGCDVAPDNAVVKQ